MVYALVMRLRNHLYDIGYKKEISFDVMTIGVGNLVMGGSGKTPLTEYLIMLLKDKFKIAVLSRGFGRSTSWIRMVTTEETVRSVGDEPIQVFRKFASDVIVAVGANRLIAIPQILQENPEVDLIVLDDIYQHRKVKPTLNLLLTNFSSPFYFDFVFPAGWLREPRRGARRADAVLVSKCPSKMTQEDMNRFKQSIKKYSEAPVFFTSVKYEDPVPFGDATKMDSPIVLVSAIANNYLFRDYCSSEYTVIKHFTFEDHHYYTEQEVQNISEFARSKNASIITTEKDMVKLIDHKQIIGTASWFYLPVSVYFLNDEKDFHGMILAKARALHSRQN